MPAQEREHIEIGDKQLRQPFYYKKWWQCMNESCQTSTFMRDEFKVWNKNAAARDAKTLIEAHEEQQQQLDFLRSI